jgi:hypothetical protein
MRKRMRFCWVRGMPALLTGRESHMAQEAVEETCGFDHPRMKVKTASLNFL